MFLSTSQTINNYQTNKNLGYLLIGTLFITAFLLYNNLGKKKVIFFGSLIIDNYSTVLKILLIIFTIIFLSMSATSIQKNFPLDFEFLILLIFSVVAVLLLVSTNDLITFYLSIELQSLCLYVLAAFKRTSQFSSEAGLKYFVLGAFSSSILLFGMSLIYGFSGSTNFTEISQLIISAVDSQDKLPYTFQLGFIFLLCGFLFKLTAVPFHI